MRDTYIGELNATKIEQKVRVCGWVSKIREHGENLAFVDVRDYSGVVQCVVLKIEDLRPEYVVKIEAVVAPRPQGTENTALGSGEIELRECAIEVLSKSEPLPFSLDDRAEVDEATRLRYRYVDLRRQRMQTNLRLRSKVNSAIRESMEENGFVEVETPLLWTPTPEGAREFLVPSRLQQGSFYVLPQSPQIAKQLLMVAGFDRYYQIARCLRDEDLRSDRQFEFSQLDLEASFVGQDDIMRFISDAVKNVVKKVSGETLSDIPRISWREAIDSFGSDKPDRRFGHKLIDVSDVFSKTSVKALTAPHIKAMLAPNAPELSRSKLDALVDRAKSLGAKGLLWMRVTGEAGREILESPVSKFLSSEESTELISVMSAKVGDVILMVGDEWSRACSVLGQIRIELGKSVTKDDVLDFFWVVDFPLFEGEDDEGRLISAHHPFTMANEQDLEHLSTDPLSVRSQSYDLVVNGWEIGSGSIRIHRADIQRQIFSLLGVDSDQAQARFGFLLDAFKYGAPPHGGFAFGIDRLVAVLVGEDNIREVIAYPKTQSGADLMTGAPKEVEPKLLDNLGLVRAKRP